MKKMKKALLCVAAGILLLAAGSNQAAAGPPVFMSLQAAKVTIDTNDDDRDFAVIRMRKMTGLDAAVSANVPLRVKLVTVPGSFLAYNNLTNIAAADINGNRLQYQDADIKLTCNLSNELCNLVIKRTGINEVNLPRFAGEKLKVVVKIDGTRYVHRALWSKTDSSSQIKYTFP